LNKIQWQDWGKETFEKARAAGKPVLLDIKGSWCHWCHVMDDTSYSDPSIIDTVNKQFIPVRVDTDKRPDVNRRYNMGGWPTTAFLDADGRIITGGTYIPPQQLREVLRSVLDFYSKNKGRVQSKLQPINLPKPTGGPASERILKDIVNAIAVNFDIDYGGFGMEPKFPHTDALDLALLRYKYSGEKEELTIANKTLDKMGRGGMYDQVEGGFFRYSTTRDWSIPHFEKMAEDNARLLGVYVRAFQVTGTEYYREVAEGIVRFVQAKLSDMDNGGFYGSQDADEEYYKLGKEGRAKATAPSVDKTFYTNYNAQFVSSFLLASIVLERPELAAFALKSLDRILQLDSKSGGFPHYFGSEISEVKGLLVDYAWVLHALLDAYEYSAKWSFVEKAKELANMALKTLLDEQDGGLYDIPESDSRVGELRSRDKPLDENSVMSSALQRLAWTTGIERFSEIAGKTLQLFTDSFERHGLMAAGYGIALDSYLNGPVQVTVVGSQKGKPFQAFKIQALKTYSGRRSILYLDPAKDGERVKKQGYETVGGVKAYVCLGKVCGPPLKTPGEIERSLASLLLAPTARIIS
jgi:uncharacterized protein